MVFVPNLPVYLFSKKLLIVGRFTRQREYTLLNTIPTITGEESPMAKVTKSALTVKPTEALDKAVAKELDDKKEEKSVASLLGKNKERIGENTPKPQ